MKITSNNEDKRYMRYALNLAKRNLGNTGKNPSVGCVIVSKEKKIISAASTGLNGSPHAEKIAIEKSCTDIEGATVYVTLEPCNHSGENPPCAELLVKEKISRVVISQKDDNPLVDGKGIKFLKDSNVIVDTGVLEEEANLINGGFLNRVKNGKPNINIKIASSADGKTALRDGKSKWITNDLSRKYGHRLRSTHDAILVGINTVLSDDPMLNCRLEGLQNRSPCRIILDTGLRIPEDSKIIKTAEEINTIIFTNLNANRNKIKKLERLNVKVLKVSQLEDSYLNVDEILLEIGKAGFNNLLIEGGHTIITSFLSSENVKLIYWFSSDKIIGGDGLSSIGNLNLQNIKEGPNLKLIEIINLNNNYLKTYEVLK